MPKKLVSFSDSGFFKNVCFTLNNYTDQDWMSMWHLTRDEANYCIMAREVGESGTPHIQGYIEWRTKKRGSTLKKINPRIHWEPRLGMPSQARDYCKKEGSWAEHGVISEDPKQGQRTDLISVRDKIESGTRVDDIALEDPEMFHQYGRTLSKLEDLVMRKKFRTEMTTCDWYWGSTGVGKSHRAFKDYSPETHYVWKDDKGWWDKYTQQDFVILNDFRGEIPYNTLLQMIDKWPFDVSRRGREPMPFISKHIIITSSLSPEEVYKRRNEEDSLDQLFRRIKVHKIPYCLCEKCSEGNTGLLSPVLGSEGKQEI